MDKELWRIGGRAAAVLLIGLLAALPARAQQGAADAPLLRTSVIGTGDGSTVDDLDAATSGAGADTDISAEEPGTDGERAGQGSPAVEEEAPSAATEVLDGEGVDAAEAGPADGLLAEPEGPLDGDIPDDGRLDAVAQPADEAPATGAAAIREPPEDIDPFEPEPSLPRTAYPEEETSPFEPAGIGIGSFRLFPETTAGTILTDNVQEAPGGSGDVALELRPSLRLQSEWSSHSLEATAAGRATFQKRFSGEDDRELTLGLRGQLDVSEETDLQGELGYDLRQQSRSAIDFPAGAAGRPEIATTRALVALDHRINRLFMRVGLGLRRENESAGEDGGAVAATNDDFSEGEALVRVGYEVSPGFSLFVEGVAGRRSFDQVADSDGRLRDASLRELEVGVAVELAPKLEGELAIGHGRIDPDDARLEGADGIILDGSLTWQPSALTTVRFAASSTLEPTTLADAAGVLGQTYDLEVRHALRRNLAVTAGIATTLSDYQGAGIEERRSTGRLGAEHVLSREWALLADYEHLRFQSSEAGADYTSDTLRLAARLRR